MSVIFFFIIVINLRQVLCQKFFLGYFLIRFFLRTGGPSLLGNAHFVVYKTFFYHQLLTNLFIQCGGFFISAAELSNVTEPSWKRAVLYTGWSSETLRFQKSQSLEALIELYYSNINQVYVRGNLY